MTAKYSFLGDVARRFSFFALFSFLFMAIFFSFHKTKAYLSLILKQEERKEESEVAQT